MLFLTEDKSSTLEALKRKARQIEDETKVVTLKGGPFSSQSARIKKRYNHYATTIPESVATNWPPLEFDGVPNIAEPLAFVVYYKRQHVESKQYEFEGIRVYKKTGEAQFPYGYEQIKN